jgi:hypothetical protein
MDPNSGDTMIGQIPLGTGVVRWGAMGGDQVVSVQSVIVAGNGDILVQYLPDDASTDPFGMQSTESNTGQGRVLRFSVEDLNSSPDLGNLMQAIDMKFPTRQGERNFFNEAYNKIFFGAQ